MTAIVLLVLGVPRPLAETRPTLPVPVGRIGPATPEGLEWWMRHPSPPTNPWSPPALFPFDLPKG